MKNTTENNKLIAKFMLGEELIKTMATPDMYFEKRFTYNSNWNYLMKVVEKINSNRNFYILVNCIPENGGKFCSEAYTCSDFSKQSRNLISSFESDYLIETVYNSCIAFINWYNEQRNTNIQDSIDVDSWSKFCGRKNKD